jgi:hypothetical protein
MAHTTNNTALLTRQEIWSRELKDVLLDELSAQRYVRWLSEFPDGNTFTIPSIGEATVRDYVENNAVVYDALDTGEFQFNITEYVSSATFITKQAMQDMFYMQQLVSSFVPKQRRAIEEKLETDILAVAESGQTATDTNTINGRAHRLIGQGTSNVIDVSDFALASLALKKANVPMNNMIAIVDPSVGYTLETLTNLVNVSNNPRWEGIVGTGITTGMKFIKNVYGFDVWESNYLPSISDATVDGTTAPPAANAVNQFFSADASVVPYIGAWRQMPEVDAEYNKDLQREEYVTTARYGVSLYRPENMVTICTNTAV